MHKWFKKVGLNSHHKPLSGGFKLEHDSIYASAHVYEKIRKNLNEPSKPNEEINDLIWGSQKPKLPYKLWKINELENTCSKRMKAHLLADLNLL